MATNPIGGESANVTHPDTLPPAAAGRIASKLLNRHSPHEIAEAIEVLVDVLDCLGGDPEAEDATDLEDDHSLSEHAHQYTAHQPGCAVSDGGDISATEWHTRGRFKLSPGIIGKNGMPISEDVEEDDVPEEDDEDCAVDDTPCDDINMDLEVECDAEREQMVHDVPMLPVVSYEHNLFSDQRVSLGISNLMTSFVCKEVVSADTGAVHRYKRAGGWPKPGSPVLLSGD